MTHLSAGVRIVADSIYSQNALIAAYQDTVEVHCVFDSPAAPTADTTNSTSLTVNWGAYSATGFTTSHYEVQYRAGKTGKWQTVPHEDTKHPTSDTTYTLSSLTSGQSYQVRYRALDDIAGSNPTRYVGTKWSPAVSPASLTASVNGNSVTLSLANWPATRKWWYQGHRGIRNFGGCTEVATGTTAPIGSLPAGPAYTYTAYSDATCSTKLASQTFTIPPPALVVHTRTETTATLELTNWQSFLGWYYQRRQPTVAPCVQVVSGYTVNLSTLTPGTTYTYAAYSSHTCSNSLASQTFTTLGTAPVPDDDTDDGPGTDTGTTGGSGGGGTPSDQHGNTPATASFPRLGGTMRGYIQSPADVDYFRVSVPANGILSVRTTGTTNTTGTLEQDGNILTTDDNSGSGTNFHLTAPVTPGTYYVAVRGSAPGPYTLAVRLVQGRLETPAAGTTSAQSGLSVLRGWVCEAELIDIELERADGTTYLLEPASGTARGDVAATCGGAVNTGFGLLWNWNILGEGSYIVRALADDIVFGEATVTVTMPDPSEEYLTGVSGQSVVADFPAAGQEVRLVWSQSLQNFSLTTPEAELPPRPASVSVPWGTLENPTVGSSFQSGLGVLSGWVCEAEAVILEVTTEAGVTYALEMAYGTARGDAAERCAGKEEIGFGLLFNWNLLGAGVHTLRAVADGEEFGRAAIRVTTLGSEYPTGLQGQAEVVDFPEAGQTTRLEWQEAAQNFVITGVE